MPQPTTSFWSRPVTAFRVLVLWVVVFFFGLFAGYEVMKDYLTR